MTTGDGSSMWNDTAGGMINDIPPNMHSGDEAAFYYDKGWIVWCITCMHLFEEMYVKDILVTISVIEVRTLKHVQKQ